jgi:methyl-accepting chemotaxis protein
MDGINLSKVLQEFYEKNKHEKFITNWEESLKSTEGFFGYNFLNSSVGGDDISLITGKDFTRVHNEKDFIFSLSGNQVFYYKNFLLYRGNPSLFKVISREGKYSYLKVNYSNIGNLRIRYEKKLGIKYPFYKLNDYEGNQMSDLESHKLFEEIHSIIKTKANKYLKILEQKRLKDLKELEQKRLKNLQDSQTNVLNELDKDGDGQVDVVGVDDFNSLLKKHQKNIIEIDRNYVQQFVKISSYLKTKKGNIQSIFNSIKDTPNQEVLNEYVEILKDEIHCYNLILLNSLNMIVSLVEDNMITFYEIHEKFDDLNMFSSKHEKDISQKLENIGDGLKNLIYEIRRQGEKISYSIQDLSYVTKELNNQLINQLSEIDSTLKVGNLINTINAYQNYKNNR